MPRQKRIVIPGVPHHVWLRGNNRRRLFTNDEDRWFWMRCLDKGIEVTQCALHQHTLMSNHTHGLFTPPTKDALSELIKRACQRYTQGRNGKLNASGKLFEERFHSKPITDEKHLLFTLLYNDANAYRARMVKDPTDHAWSTGPLHDGRPRDSKIPASMWTPLPFYLRLGRTVEERASEYRRLMAAYLRDETWTPVDDGSEEPDDRRLIARPDGTSAREPVAKWGRKPK